MQGCDQRVRNLFFVCDCRMDDSWARVSVRHTIFTKVVIASVLTLSLHNAAAQSPAFRSCMERAEAIRITAQVRDRGVNQVDYIAGLKKFNGRELSAYENEVITTAYAAKAISPDELERMAVTACNKYR